MPTKTENLWPKEFGGVDMKTPVAILREQAIALGELTANIVVGRVTSRPVTNTDKFEHILSLYSSPLGYSIVLLTIEHDIELYPVTVRAPSDPTGTVVSNQDEFTSSLREIFSREKTKKTIASLIAQSNE